jgi:hypothetical protein
MDISKGVNEPSLDELGLSRLGSFIFGPGSSSSSSRAWVGCSSSAQQGLNRARARVEISKQNQPKSKSEYQNQNQQPYIHCPNRLKQAREKTNIIKK